MDCMDVLLFEHLLLDSTLKTIFSEIFIYTYLKTLSRNTSMIVAPVRKILNLGVAGCTIKSHHPWKAYECTLSLSDFTIIVL